jgi:predicted MFS family arabinose efflux permease
VIESETAAATPTAAATAPAASERLIVLLVGAVQFVNVLDFMMVMPLGPDFAAALGIATSHIGVVGGSYTLAAAASGLIGSLFLDRFDRRLALGVAMLGLVLGTALGGLASGLTSLLLARVIAGSFGGPATSLSLAIIADAIPPARRGKAMGAVMAAFSVASVLGVPAGLELAERFGWRAPFFAVAGFGLLLTLSAVGLMPPMRGHLTAPRPTGPKVRLLDSVTGIALANTALVTVGVFAVVPNISAFIQHNLAFPRGDIGGLYLIGGLASFAAMRVAGVLVDRYGATLLVVLGTALHAFALVTAFVHQIPWLPLAAVFTIFMLSASVRMVPLQTLSSRVPWPAQRARFMSAQSAVQHAASAVGAMLASAMLIAAPDGKLIHMDTVALGALVVACLVPFGAYVLEKRVKAREAIPVTERSRIAKAAKETPRAPRIGG